MKNFLFSLVFLSGIHVSGQSPNVCLSPSAGSPFSLAMNSYPRSIAAYDFNGDGKSDIAVADQTSNNLSVMLNTGNGTFGAPALFALPGPPYMVISGDVNSDGKLDLITANNSGPFEGSVLLGNGSGSFGAAMNFSAGANPQALAMGDFNNDTKQDLVLTSGSSVSVLLGSGTGAFGVSTSFAAGSMPQGVVVGDFNNDGNKDIAACNRMSFDISILLGNGAGNFAAAVNYPATAMFPCSIVSGDFNGDGKMDLATSNFDFNNTKNISVLLNAGAGTFGAATIYSVMATGSAVSIASGDMNGDGFTDLVTLNSNAYGILPGDGTGNFGASMTTTLSSASQFVAVKDFNNDSRLDLALPLGNNDQVEVLLNRSAIIMPSGPITFCNGNNVTLLATKGGSSYAWAPGGATTDSLVVTTGGTYSVSVATGACISTASISITVNALPTVTIASSGSMMICNGQSTNLMASGALTYTWVSGPGTALYLVSPGVTTSYTVTGTDANGCMNSDSKTVTVNPLPSIIAFGPSSAVCAGQMSTITASGTPTYSWSTGSSASSITVNPTVTTSYTVYGTDGNGCTNSAISTITVVVCSGLNELSAEANTISIYPNPNNGIFNVRWNHHGTLLLVNELGQIIKSLNFDSNVESFEINGLQKGIYFVHGVNNNIRQKIVVLD